MKIERRKKARIKSMNHVMLMGRLTADPSINDKATCASFTLAVDRKYSKGEKKEADFISCKMLGEKKSEFAGKYLRKGVKIALTGAIQTGSYQKKDGTKVYTTDVIVESTEFCESKGAGQGDVKSQGKQSDSSQEWMTIPDGADDSLPFD